MLALERIGVAVRLELKTLDVDAELGGAKKKAPAVSPVSAAADLAAGTTVRMGATKTSTPLRSSGANARSELLSLEMHVHLRP